MTSIQDYLDPTRRYLAAKDYGYNQRFTPKPRPDQAIIDAWLAARLAPGKPQIA